LRIRPLLRPGATAASASMNSEADTTQTDVGDGGAA
jgi:hypothetical protein